VLTTSLILVNGVEAMVGALNTQFSATFAQQAWTSYTVAGQKAGQFKNAGTFSYVRIYGAGHEVPAYKYGEGIVESEKIRS
jgi:carboxypeptidase C (cathepsin A)